MKFHLPSFQLSKTQANFGWDLTFRGIQRSPGMVMSEERHSVVSALKKMLSSTELWCVRPVGVAEGMDRAGS